MNNIKISHLLFLILFLAVPVTNTFLLETEPAKAWSGNTHGRLSEVAIRFMPSPWDVRLMGHRKFFNDHSDEPDVIRSRLMGEEYRKEAPRHYVDADVRPNIYGNATHHPQPEFNMTYNSDDPRESSDYQLGVAPWAVENWTVQLTEDLMIYDWNSDTILMDMCMLAHYVQDSWMPFHAVSYYNGQRVPASGSDAGLFYKGGQEGIHSYIERDFIGFLYDDDIDDILDRITGEAQYVNPYMASLGGILTGQTITDEILDVADVHGYTFGEDTWLRAVWDLTGGSEGNLTRRLINASIETANVWFTAFNDAGLIEQTTTINTSTANTESQTSTIAGSIDFSALELILIVSLTVLCILTAKKRK